MDREQAAYIACNEYIAPKIDTEDITMEKGFAASTEGWESAEWLF